jgi:hypothetical protein
LFLAALVGGEVLIGCGGGASAGSHVTHGSTSIGAAAQPIHHPWPTQAVAPAIAACKRAVARAISLPASSRHEIAEPCDRMDERVKENKALVRAVCQELASAVPVSPGTPSTKHIASACYDEYAKTLK